MKSRFLSLAAVTVAFGCSDASVGVRPLFDAPPAKGGTTTQRVDFTITDAGLSLVSDGKGTYQDGVCGSWGSWSNDVMFLAPNNSKIPKSQQASCTGIAPRRATVALAVKHLSDNPHVDDDQSPTGGGVYEVANVKFGFGSALATTINATTAFCGSAGLRFTPVTYPGSSDTIREDLGGGLWHMYTRPWPDNKAYCENNGVVAFWHVSFDLYAHVR